MPPHISRADYTEFHESIEELRAGRAEEQETDKREADDVATVEPSNFPGNFSRCLVCGLTTHEQNLDGTGACPQCSESNQTPCAICSAKVCDDDLIPTRHGRICESCLEAETGEPVTDADHLEDCTEEDLAPAQLDIPAGTGAKAVRDLNPGSKAWNVAYKNPEGNWVVVGPRSYSAALSLAAQINKKARAKKAPAPTLYPSPEDIAEAKAVSTFEGPGNLTMRPPEPCPPLLEVDSQTKPHGTISSAHINEKFSTDGKSLYVFGRKVLKAWESFSGWYWFAVEKVCDQESDLGDGKGTPDTIWFGYVQGLEEDWGEFSEAEIRALGYQAWPIKRCDLPISGRRN